MNVALRRLGYSKDEMTTSPDILCSHTRQPHEIAMTSAEPEGMAPIHILRLPDVCEITGLCRSLVYQLESVGAFPKRVRLTRRTVGWIEGEVQAWLAQRIQSSRADPRTSV
jgi:prophage regulatory protein